MKAKLLSFLFLISFLNLAQAEVTQKQITRTKQSAMELSADLSKDIYRSEPYQSEYEVQIPYEVEETYYEDVPYEEQEAYTDYESYYENEYVCHTKTDYENECHNEQRCETRTEYENVCGYERQCRTINGPDECHSERVCRPSPGREICENVEECGTNAHGERICKTRRVCHNERGPDDCHEENRCHPGSSREECSNEYVCRQEPRERQECRQEQVCRQIPHERQECGYEQVEKTRSVTKYRTVTKYRKEARTRTVTKYRTETRCCETRYRDVFDHTAQLKVNVVFPAGSELEGNESETLLVKMTAENQGTFKIQQSIFGYTIQSESVANGVLRLILALAPKYQAGDLGQATIQNLSFVENAKKAQIQFVDSGLRPRVQTQYQYQILEKETERVIEEGTLGSTGSQDVVVKGKEILNPDLAYFVKISVTRTGVVLAATETFLVTADKIKGQLKPDDFANKALFKDPRLRNGGGDTELLLHDQSPDHPEVVTIYSIEVQHKSGFLGRSWKTFANAQQKRLANVDAQGIQHFSFVRDLKVSEKDVDAYAKSGKTLNVKITVTRKSPRLNSGKAITFSKEIKVKVQ